jgi:hypothetical protein
MKIAIISDVHNNLANLKKVLDYCAKNEIKKIICCGDLANMETLDFLNDNFSGVIYYTFGNMDDGQMTDVIWHPERIRQSAEKSKDLTTCRYKNTFIFKKFGEVEIEKNPAKPDGRGTRRIAFVHYPDKARELCESGKYDFVFHGHTHKPWSSEASAKETAGSNKCIILNPGNIANEIYPPTFAVWEIDNDKFDLIRINNLK